MTRAIPRVGERISLERIEAYVRRFGPVTTMQVAAFFRISNSGLPKKLGSCPNLVSRDSSPGGPKIWEYKHGT